MTIHLVTIKQLTDSIVLQFLNNKNVFQGYIFYKLNIYRQELLSELKKRFEPEHDVHVVFDPLHVAHSCEQLAQSLALLSKYPSSQL